MRRDLVRRDFNQTPIQLLEGLSRWPRSPGAQPSPARHTWSCCGGHGQGTPDLCFTSREGFPVLCLSQGEQPRPACPHGCAMSLPATKATQPRSCQREPRSGRVGAIRRQWGLLLGGAGA